jgi:wobble nucleotide-excising tRNase
VLIRGIIKEIDDPNSEKKFNAKQIFILTHNLYFFNQITYIKHGVKTKNKSYYTVSKTTNISKIIPSEHSPVNSSYKLLWKGINDNQYDCRNNMRRILETYIKFTCDTNYDSLDDKFDNPHEKEAYQSLIAFLHDGSHNIIDDYEFSNIDSTIEIYKNVFRKIFESIGHIAHYNTMMGIEETTEKETNGNLNNIFDQQNARVSQ